MAIHNRFGTPRFYIDYLGFFLTTGWRDLDNIATVKKSDGTTAVTFDAGSEASLFDQRPTNFAQIANTNQSFYIQLDTGLGGSDAYAESNYIAILNHNFEDADCMFKVELDDSDDMSSATVVSASANHTKIFNATQATGGNSDFLTPNKNGMTLITWTTVESDNRYLRITFKDTGGATANFNEDVIIGSVMWGEFFDMPNAPDLDIKTEVEFDGVKKEKSLGGHTYTTSTFLGNPTWNKTLPFNISSTSGQKGRYFQQRSGRLKHSMNFSFLSDTNVFSEDMHSETLSEWYDTLTLHNSFYNKVLGSQLPFLFTIDKDSLAEGSYGLFRLTDKGLIASQVSNRLYNVAINIEETW